jgi:hypothetical protein
MKALSVRAPWWWAILHGGKDTENRKWSTNFRGTILLHASNWHGISDIRDDLEFIELTIRATGCKLSDIGPRTFMVGGLPTTTYGLADLPELQAARGSIVGKVDIIDCVSHSDSRWFFGPYGFVLANPVAFETPIPWKGALGFFEVPDDLVPEARVAPTDVRESRRTGRED